MLHVCDICTLSFPFSGFSMFSHVSEYIFILHIHLSHTDWWTSSIFSLVDQGRLWHTSWGNPVCPFPQDPSHLSQHFIHWSLSSLWTQIKCHHVTHTKVGLEATHFSRPIFLNTVSQCFQSCDNIPWCCIQWVRTFSLPFQRVPGDSPHFSLPNEC